MVRMSILTNNQRVPLKMHRGRSEDESKEFTREIPQPGVKIGANRASRIPKTIEPLATDILLGRGSALARHEGNRILQHYVICNLKEFKSSARRDRQLLIHRMLHELKTQGLRFLKYENGEWHEVATKCQYTKVRDSFRYQKSMECIAPIHATSALSRPSKGISSIQSDTLLGSGVKPVIPEQYLEDETQIYDMENFPPPNTGSEISTAEHSNSNLVNAPYIEHVKMFGKATLVECFDEDTREFLRKLFPPSSAHKPKPSTFG